MGYTLVALKTSYKGVKEKTGNSWIWVGQRKSILRHLVKSISEQSTIKV